MVLQRPVGCEQHATTSAWSAAGAPASKPRSEQPVALPPGPDPSVDAMRADDDLLPNPELMVLFSRAEYQRLCALRARVQRQRVRGRRPDDLDVWRNRPDEGGVSEG